MGLDTNALRKLGFSRKQASALAPELGSGATFTDTPVENWLPYVWAGSGMEPRLVLSGAEVDIDPVILEAPGDWLDNPDVALVVADQGKTKYQVQTSGLYLVQAVSLSSKFRQANASPGPDPVDMDPLTLSGYTICQLAISSPSWGTSINGGSTLPMNSGEINWTQTLYLPAGTVLSVTLEHVLWAMLDLDGTGPGTTTARTTVDMILSQFSINLTRFAPAI